MKIKSSVRGRFPPYFFCPRDVPDTNIHMGMIVDNSLFTETYGRFKGGNRGISVEKILVLPKQILFHTLFYNSVDKLSTIYLKIGDKRA